jgi:hypothetical protein
VAKKREKHDIPESVVALVQSVCDIAGPQDLIDDARVELAAAGVIEAVKRRRDATIFEWLMDAVSFQGISDSVAAGYIAGHEKISAASVSKALRNKPSCEKLQGYHRFFGCNYRKWRDTCAEPEHKADCPLPRHDLRNGRLNRTAYALWMFMRDVSCGDFVGWCDYQLRPSMLHELGTPDIYGGPIVGPMSHIEGIGPKVLSMSLATLLLAGDVDRPEWIEAGARMIAIDSLVHAWLHRTGILKLMGGEHAYGAACYQEAGCAEIIEAVSKRIDVRKFNRSYPRNFPRFVQFSIWRFCAQDELNICNGNKIDDLKKCKQVTCPLYAKCARQRFHPAQRRALTHAQ